MVNQFTELVCINKSVQWGNRLNTVEAIRRNNNIKGITVNGQKIKISQYADDTTLILDGSKMSFQNSLQVLELYSAISGLRLNYKKTEVLWIGASVGSECNGADADIN